MAGRRRTGSLCCFAAGTSPFGKGTRTCGTTRRRKVTATKSGESDLDNTESTSKRGKPTIVSSVFHVGAHRAPLVFPPEATCQNSCDKRCIHVNMISCHARSNHPLSLDEALVVVVYFWM